MAVPILEIEGCKSAHRRLLATVEGLTEEQPRRPSRLANWTVAQVLTHIARNADSVVRRLEGAARGEVVDQYPGGVRGRESDIEAGAARSAHELVDDVRSSALAVEAACASLPPPAWDRLTRNVDGKEQPGRLVLFARWREVEVHHVDLNLGYSPTEWPTELVDAWLPDVLHGLAGRADPRSLLAWSLGRGPAPDLAPWG